MRRKALTLVEALIALSIMSILAGMMTLNGSTVGEQTTKREAERVAGFFRSHMLRADMTHDVLWFDVKPSSISLSTGIEAPTQETAKLEASAKCSFLKEAASLYLSYNYDKAYTSLEGSYGIIPAFSSVDISAIKTNVNDLTAIDGRYCLTISGADNKHCIVSISM